MTTAKVISYLDCGCAILKDGNRSWCPSCMAPPPPAPVPDAFAIVNDQGFYVGIWKDKSSAELMLVKGGGRQGEKIIPMYRGTTP